MTDTAMTTPPFNTERTIFRTACDYIKQEMTVARLWLEAPAADSNMKLPHIYHSLDRASEILDFLAILTKRDIRYAR